MIFQVYSLKLLMGFELTIQAMTTIKLSRHTGMDCRYPVHRDVNQFAILGFWSSAIPAGTTQFSLV